MNPVLTVVELSKAEFTTIRDMLYQICGINMPPGKEGLVKARLTKRLRLLQLDSFQDYIAYLKADRSGQEIAVMVDELTTNKTNFFRESVHFDFLDKTVLPHMGQAKKMRFWSAACSTGEEPYSLAIQLCDSLKNISAIDLKILATDISPTVLSKAREGDYGQSQMDGISDERMRKYFTLAQKTPPIYSAGDRIRSFINFARLNLMDDWPMQGPFDVIFCRNVMIYFDKTTRERLVNRFYDVIRPGGYLFVGHSESLSGMVHPFDYVQPATYLKS